MEKGSFVNRLKDGIHDLMSHPSIESWLHRLGLTLNDAVNCAMLFGVSFAIGFIFKKYFKFIIGASFFMGFVGLILQSHGIIIVNWPAFKAFVGFDPMATDVRFMFTFLVEIVKANVVHSVSAIAGLVLGYKMG